MKCSATFLVLVGIVALGPNHSSAMWVPYTNDFDSGIGSEFSVVNGSGLFTVDTDSSALRISKPEDDGSIETNGVITAGILSDFFLVGDFTVTVDFSLDDLPIASYPGLNESILRCFQSPASNTGSPGEGEFSLLHFTRSGFPQYQVGAWPSGYYSTTTALHGRYRITRNGSNMAAYLDEDSSGDFSLVWQGSQFSDPVQVGLMGIQGQDIAGYPRSTTALDISFDNLDIVAEDIVPEPSTIVLLIMGALGLLFFRRR